MITVHVVEDRLMCASDTVMPCPYVVGGDLDDMIQSLRAIKMRSLENLVQGHGEVLLRGEIEETLDASIVYLQRVDRLVRERIARAFRAAASSISPSRSVVCPASLWEAWFRNCIRRTC